jgi:hypothetical protein
MYWRNVKFRGVYGGRSNSFLDGVSYVAKRCQGNRTGNHILDVGRDRSPIVLVYDDSVPDYDLVEACLEMAQASSNQEKE